MSNTVNVPEGFAAVFEKAEALVGQYFRTKVEAAQKGTIEISGERHLLVRAASLSVDFFDTVAAVYRKEGAEQAQNIARQFLFDIAHAIGKQDARHFHNKWKLTDSIDKLSAGPIYIAHSGWACVEILPESAPSPNEDCYLLYDHPNSFEADAWLAAGRESEFPVCVMNAGYTSGWCEQSFGITLVASEVLCRVKGDHACRFIMAPPSRIESHIAGYLKKSPELAKCITRYEIPGFFRRKEAEEALRQSEARYRNVFEYAGDMIFMLAPDGTVTSVNRAFEQVSGWAPADWIGRPFQPLVHPDDQSRVLTALQKALLGEKIPLFEVRILWKSGEYVECEFNLGIAQHKGTVSILGVAREVAARKRAEERNRQLATIVTSSNDAIVSKTLDGTITSWNPAAEKIYGYSEQEAVGQPINLLLPPGRESEVRQLWERIQQGEHLIHVETVRRRKDGQDIDVFLTVSPLRDEQGRVQGVSTFSRDITAAKRTEHALQRLVRTLQQRDREMRLIHNLNDALQTCQSHEEAYRLISLSASELFVKTSGTLALLNSSGQFLETVARWGEDARSQPLFALEDCWALRSGHPYVVTHRHERLLCRHFASAPGGGYLCLPLVVHGEVQGLLHLAAQQRADLASDHETLASTFGETIKLSLANIKLRESLREEANRDALTGLYNRRYLDETLPRELHRAVRAHSPLCMALLDIDHFKPFNDAFGHAAGDEVLKAVGGVLGRNVRSSDIPCRLGGEEFAMILPDASWRDAYRRLQQICDRVRDLGLSFDGQSLPPVTFSAGLVEAPRGGPVTTDDLMKKADQALYAAKQAGRDRIEVFRPGST